jgi:hypothetical protein
VSVTLGTERETDRQTQTYRHAHISWRDAPMVAVLVGIVGIVVPQRKGHQILLHRLQGRLQRPHLPVPRRPRERERERYMQASTHRQANALRYTDTDRQRDRQAHMQCAATPAVSLGAVQEPPLLRAEPDPDSRACGRQRRLPSQTECPSRQLSTGSGLARRRHGQREREREREREEHNAYQHAPGLLV